MRYYITIPEPCHENWQNMAPNEQGRHCSQCCKTVIDFSAWELPEIIYYLKAHQSENLCGRFKNEQLDTPVITSDQFVWHISQTPLSYLKKVAAVFLFVFGLMATSCNNPQTSIAIPVSETQRQEAAFDQGTLGLPRPTYSDSTQIAMPVKRVEASALSNPGEVGHDEDMSHTGGAPVMVEEPIPDTSQIERKHKEALLHTSENSIDTVKEEADTMGQ